MGVSLGRFWERSGRNLDQQTLWCLMFALFCPVRGCVVDVFSLLTRGVAGAVCCTGFGSLVVPMFLSSLLLFRALRKWPTRVAYRKNQKVFMILRSCSRRPRCDQEAWHDAKTSSKNCFLGTRNRLMFFDFSCPRCLENGTVEHVAFGG